MEIRIGKLKHVVLHRFEFESRNTWKLKVLFDFGPVKTKRRGAKVLAFSLYYLFQVSESKTCRFFQTAMMAIKSVGIEHFEFGNQNNCFSEAFWHFRNVEIPTPDAKLVTFELHEPHFKSWQISRSRSRLEKLNRMFHWNLSLSMEFY